MITYISYCLRSESYLHFVNYDSFLPHFCVRNVLNYLHLVFSYFSSHWGGNVGGKERIKKKWGCRAEGRKEGGGRGHGWGGEVHLNRNEQRSREGGRGGRGRGKSCAVSNLVSKVLGELPQHCRICKQLTDSINQWLHNAMHTIQSTYILMKGVGAKGWLLLCAGTPQQSARARGALHMLISSVMPKPTDV